MYRTLKTHRYLGLTIETLFGVERVEENDGSVWFHAEVQLRVQFGEPTTVYDMQCASERQALEWARSMIEDEDFECIG